MCNRRSIPVAKAIALSVSLATAACSSSRSGVDPLATDVSVSSAIAATLDLPRTVPNGGVIPVTIALVNTSDSPVQLSLTGRVGSEYIGIVVMNTVGDTVTTIWNSSVILRILSTRTLSPRQRIEFAARLPLPSAQFRLIQPGEYVVRGRVMGESTTLIHTNAQPLTITP